jgi:hypothetical protein
VHNHAFMLTGRRSFMGYSGTLWTHGIAYVDREEALKKIFRGAPEALDLVQANGLDYAVVGPLEDINPGSINREFFDANFPRVAEVRGAVIYKVRK